MGNTYDLVASQGATFDVDISWTDASGNAIDLTGYTGQMKVKKNYGATEIIELTSANGRIVISAPTSGVVKLLISSTDTASLANGTYKYDLMMDSGTAVTKLLSGAFTVDESITI